jgi:glycogen debranching enzyme
LKPIIPLFRVGTPGRLSAAQGMKSVTSKSGLGVYASSDHLFKGAVFGRDSLEVAEDIIAFREKLVERILLTLASLQGEEFNSENEEEPGKIIHEYRTNQIDGQPIDESSAEILRRLSERWGGTSIELAYYGSVDSTPFFVRTLSWYCMLYGKEILRQKVRLRSGKELTMADVMERSLGWIFKKLEESKSGFLEYKRLNPHGIENQVWKDSQEFYVHPDGTLVNHDRPISSIEVQALTYDALKTAARLLPLFAPKLNTVADKLRDRTIKLLWMPEREYFALGTDYDEDGKLRVIKTLTANPAEILDSNFFDELPSKEKTKYVSAIVRTIMSYEFLTDAGIRSRALSEAGLVAFWDYHGSYTTWPKETYDVAKGLKRQGLPRLAYELENRLLNVTRAMKSFPEFFYVDQRGRVLGIPNRRDYHGDRFVIHAPNAPERIQAWTVSAILAINASIMRRRSHQQARQQWQRDLEKEVFAHIPHVPLLKTQPELEARYPAYPYQLSSNQMVQ